MKNKILRIDPTKTAALRKEFERAVRVRLNLFKKEVIKLIVTEDAFGLKKTPSFQFSVNHPSHPGNRHAAGVGGGSGKIPNSTEGLKKVGHLGGSTGARLMEDKSGNKFVTKRGSSPKHLIEENTADEIYRAVGMDVPNSKVVGPSSKPTKIAEFEKGKSLNTLTGSARKKANSKIREGFAADALLSNWDVVGLEQDNVIVQGDRVIRIDNGGSLRFRAQGAPKGNKFSDTVGEIDSMRNRGTAGKVFGKLKDTEVASQIDRLAKKRGKILKATPKDLKKTMSKRLDSMVDWAAKVRESTGNSFVENTRWRFHTNPQKVLAFKQWAKNQMSSTLVGVAEAELNKSYWRKFISLGYQKGQKRAFDSVNKEGLQENLDFFNGTREEFLRGAFNNPVSQEKVELIAGRVFTDLEGVNASMSTKMTRTLVDGLVQGMSPRNLALRMVLDIDKIGKNRALTMARTEIIRAHAEGQLDAFGKLGVEEVGAAVEFSVTELSDGSMESRVCPLCRPLDGIVVKVKEASGMIPRHPNCIVGSTKVLVPGIRTVMTAEYSGDLYDIRSSFGHRLSVTSHHILLTQRGWVFAKDLTDSDYLVNAPNKFWRPVCKYDDLTYATASQISSSFLEVAHKHRISETLAMAEYLHGDGESIDHKINIIDVDGILGDEFKTFGFSQRVKSSLGVADIFSNQTNPLPSLGSLDLFLCRLGSAADSLMSSMGIADIVLARSLLHHDLVSNCLISDSDSLISQQVSNGTAVQAKPFVKRLDTHTAQVQLDNLVDGNVSKITSINVRHVSSLSVFDFSTDSSLYVTEGVVTSNCRCAWIPANVGEKTKGQTRTQLGIESSIKTSIRAERPKQSFKKTKKESPWLGSTKSIGKKRPKSILD